MKQFRPFRILFALLGLILLPSLVQADLIKQGTAFNRTILVTDTSGNNVTGLSSGSFTTKIGKAGGSQSTITPTITEQGLGRYSVALTSGHTDTLGALDLVITAAGAVQTDTHDQVVAFDPTDGVRLGLTSLPNAAASASGGLLTFGTGSGQLNPSGGNVTSSSVTSVATGTAQAGAASTITLQSGSSATTDLYKGNFIVISSGTGAGQSRVITAYNGGTLIATVSRAWAINPDSTSVYTVVANPHPALDSALGVTAGTVSDKTGYSLTQAFPSNFSLLSIDGTGKIGLQSAEYTSITVGVLGAVASSYNTAGTIGAKINSAGSAGDPWSTALPGSYASGTAGNILGKFAFTGSAVNAQVTGYASGQDPATLVLAATVDSGGGITLNVKAVLFLSYAAGAGRFGTPVRSTSSPWTITVPWLRLDGTTTAWTRVTTYTDNTFAKPTSSTITNGTLP